MSYNGEGNMAKRRRIDMDGTIQRMGSSSLRKWSVLSLLTDEELCKIAYLHFYGGGYRDPDKLLSALFVTHDDEVYGTGLNSLIGSHDMTADNTRIAICKDAKPDVTLVKCVKVDALSGLGITKIVVGSTFGAALTNNGEVYVWGSVSGTKMVNVEDEDIMMYQSFQANKSCTFCRQYRYSEERIGTTSISKCTRCSYPTYTINAPPPFGTAVRWFVKFFNPVSCLKCKKLTSSMKLNGCDYHFCPRCNTMLEVTSNSRSLLKSASDFQAPQRLEVGEFWKISNIYCGSTFLVIETSSGHLLLWGLIRYDEYQGGISNPGNIHIKSVSCGGSHLAVISSRGELYTCGLGDKGQLGYTWTADMGHMTLRKVPLNERAVKVCCGYSSTACLMSNSSIMCFGSNMKKLSSGIISLSCSDSEFIDSPSYIMDSFRFVDITYAPSTNVFCAKTDNCMVFRWGQSESTVPNVLFNVSELAEALVDLPYTYIDASRSKHPVQQLPQPLVSLEQGNLFGNKRFSDLTLKLADGDFPVHRLVLHSYSSYFKEVLSNEELVSDVLDMSPYNPTSYKCLLKYFYRLPLEDLNCEDLFDLYTIATSYKEKDLADITSKKLKALINQDTVLKLYAKAASTNSEELLQECEIFLGSPEFKSDIISFVSQDMKNAIAILRMKSGE